MRNWGSRGIDADHAQVCLGDLDGLPTIKSFCENADGDRDTRAAESARLGIEADDVAGPDGAMKLDCVHRNCDPAVKAVQPRFIESRLINEREDDAAKDGALNIGVLGHHVDAGR